MISSDKNTNERIRIGQLDRDRWDRLVPAFDDADLCQTWSYGAARWGAGTLDHLTLSRDDQVIGAAQIATQRPPGVRSGLAYVKWGPLWRPRDAAPDPEVLRRLAAALRRHFVEERGLVLRLMPRHFTTAGPDLRPLLAECGFTRADHASLYRTVRLDLTPSLAELRAGLKKTWRARLRKAEAEGLSVRISQGLDDFAAFGAVYAGMRRHKSFIEASDLPIYEQVQADLPEPAQLHVVTCWRDGRPLAAHLCSALGDSAISLCGATAPEGRACGASYVMDWETVAWLKARRTRWYDLGGAAEPQVTRYKLGLAGRTAAVAETIGKWDAGSTLARGLLAVAERGRAFYHRLQALR